MSPTLSKSITKKLSALPPEVAEEALSVAIEKYEAQKEVEYAGVVEAGLDDLKAGRFTEIKGEEELTAFFEEGRKKALIRAAK